MYLIDLIVSTSSNFFENIFETIYFFGHKFSIIFSKNRGMDPQEPPDYAPVHDELFFTLFFPHSQKILSKRNYFLQIIFNLKKILLFEIFLKFYNK